MSKTISLSILILYISGISSAFSVSQECTMEDKNPKWIKPINDNCAALKTVNLAAAFESSVTQLGEGSYGIVRLVNFASLCNAKYKDPEYDVAIKRINMSNVEDKELEVLKELTQNGQSPYFHACVTHKSNKYLYVVQEFLFSNLDKGSTKIQIKAKTTQQAIKYFKSGFDALYKLNQLQWVHHDIKPANLMTDSSYSKVFLIDFGLAQKFSARNHELGTPLYTHIRRLTESKNDIRTDYYSYAVSIGSVYARNWDQMFKKKDRFGGKTTALECFQTSASTLKYNSKLAKELEENCTGWIADNVKEVLEPVFGKYNPSENDESKLNFTTLIVRIIKYHRYKLSPEDINRIMQILDKTKNTDKNAPLIAEMSEEFKKSKQMTKQFEEIIQAKNDYREIKNEDPDFAAKIEKLNKEREEILKRLEELKKEEKKDMFEDPVYQNHPDLFKRQQRGVVQEGVVQRDQGHFKAPQEKPAENFGFIRRNNLLGNVADVPQKDRPISLDPNVVNKLNDFQKKPEPIALRNDGLNKKEIGYNYIGDGVRFQYQNRKGEVSSYDNKLVNNIPKVEPRVEARNIYLKDYKAKDYGQVDRLQPPAYKHIAYKPDPILHKYDPPKREYSYLRGGEYGLGLDYGKIGNGLDNLGLGLDYAPKNELDRFRDPIGGYGGGYGGVYGNNYLYHGFRLI